MAIRLINLHQLPLHIDLRGGEVLVLAPGERSRALREELLYDNCHLTGWERAGWVARAPARMSEVLAEGAPAPRAAAAVPSAAPAPQGRGVRRRNPAKSQP